MENRLFTNCVGTDKKCALFSNCRIESRFLPLAALGIEQVIQRDFWANHRPIADGLLEDVIETQLGIREKIVAQPVRKNLFF